MQVIFFGAGASAAACYPLASDLLPALETMVHAERSCANLQEAWNVWRDYRDRARGPVKAFLTNPNPEVIFSFLDLYSAAQDADSRDRMARANRGEKPARRRESKQLADAQGAREQLLVCLDWFFAFRHHDDGTPEGHKRRDYLREFLNSLSAGDVVVTLNWDTTAERTLAELGRWNPTTGYGFPKPLAGGPVGSHPAQLLGSPVRVLKLHGSFGWYRWSSKLYFDDTLLGPFGFLTDPNRPGVGPPENRVLLYPSFLKQLNDPEMLRIWQQADRALREATQVRVVGYSLPRSDGAVRALLNPLRCRADCGEVFVHVSDPHAEARQRWRELLGQSTTIDDTRLGVRCG
jgi:hypothetical protein